LELHPANLGQVVYICSSKDENYAGTRTFQGPITWAYARKDRDAPGGELWMGRVGDADPDQMFYHQSFRAIQPEVPEKDSVGQNEGGRLL
jgi:hypothetical protein